MKIAILISGQLRNVELGHKYIKENIIGDYDCDIFLHSWYDKNDINIKFSKWWPAELNNDIDKVVVQLYNPKDYIIEPQCDIDVKDYNADKYEGSYRVFATLSMFTSIKRCNDIKNRYSTLNNIIYDVVVRVRYDFGIFTKIIYENYDYKNTIYFKDDCGHEPGICMNDHFAFGSVENMNHYCNTIDEIEYLYYNVKCNFNPEIFLGRNLKHLKKINCQNIGIKSGIIRDGTIDNMWISNTW